MNKIFIIEEEGIMLDLPTTKLGAVVEHNLGFFRSKIRYEFSLNDEYGTSILYFDFNEKELLKKWMIFAKLIQAYRISQAQQSSGNLDSANFSPLTGSTSNL